MGMRLPLYVSPAVRIIERVLLLTGNPVLLSSCIQVGQGNLDGSALAYTNQVEETNRGGDWR